MNDVTLHIRYQVFDDPETLPDPDKKLLNSAQSAVKNAYAPYSGFRVGAAVRLHNGEVITGTNQENTAFPSGLCAERVALYYAASRYPDVAVTAIAVTAKSDAFTIPEPVTPCGACRQVMAETEWRWHNPLRILLSSEDDGKVYLLKGINNLLPLTFSADKLKKPDHGTHFNKDL
jgi:cytidine deaminase